MIVAPAPTVLAVLMRGGSCTGLFFRPGDLPAPGEARDRVLIGAMGSPDPYGMQLNGMGRGTTSTSKCVIVSPSERGASTSITSLRRSQSIGRTSTGRVHAATSPRRPLCTPWKRVSCRGPDRGQVRVAMWQVNRGQQIQAAVDGSTGQVWLEFQSPGGSNGRGLLPTGEVTTRLTVPGLGGVEVSVVDAANAFLFVRGADLGAPLVSPVDLVGLLARAAVLRRAAAIASGLPVDGSSPACADRGPPAGLRRQRGPSGALRPHRHIGPGDGWSAPAPRPPRDRRHRDRRGPGDPGLASPKLRAP